MRGLDAFLAALERDGAHALVALGVAALQEGDAQLVLALRGAEVDLPQPSVDLFDCRVEALIDRSQKVVVYCARGNRSALAALTMKQMGYENVSSMARGFLGWADIGGEVVD